MKQHGATKLAFICLLLKSLEFSLVNDLAICDDHLAAQPRSISFDFRGLIYIGREMAVLIIG